MKNIETDDTLGFFLNKVNRKLKNGLHARASSCQITSKQWGILNFLWNHEGITPKEVSDLTLKDKPNIHRIFSQLIKKVHQAKKHPADKRSYHLFLTDEGKSLSLQLAPIVTMLLEQAAHTIKKEKFEELKNTLDKIYANLSKI